MSVIITLGWIGLIVLLVGMAFAPPLGRRSALVPQLMAAALVLLVGAMTMHGATRGRETSLETWQMTVGAGAEPAVLGTDPRCDVVLHDPHAAGVHAQVTFTDEGPTILSLSPHRRVEIDGVDVHHPTLVRGSRIVVGDTTWTVVRIGWLLPGVVLEDDQGHLARLRPPVARRLGAAIPFFGGKLETPVGRITADEAAGTGGKLWRMDDAEAASTSGPVAEVALRGRTALLRFPSSLDRHAHSVRVADPGGEPRRPADVARLVSAGDELTLGYTRYRAGIAADDSLVLEVVGLPPRHTFTPSAGLLTVGLDGDLPWGTGDPVVLQTAPTSSPDSLALISTDPSWTLSRRQGFLWLHEDPAETRSTEPAVLAAGSGLIISGPRHEVVYRYRTPASAVELLRGAHPGTPESRLVRTLTLSALLYLLLTVVLTLTGYLHQRSAAVVHGPALLIALGLATLAELSPVSDPRYAGIVLRQATYVLVGLGAGTVLSLAGAAYSALRPRSRPPMGLLTFLEEPILRGRLRGRLGTVSRVWLLWVAAALALVLQLPFGETGLHLPLVGSLQPVALAKTLLMVFVAFLSVRAIEDKRFRLRDSEGFRSRWTYMLHALPILAVALLCVGLNDISPILVLALFLWVMYLVTLLRPSRRFWPPSAWLENVYIEQFLLLGLAGLALWAGIRLEDGTVAQRFEVWRDPWLHTSSSSQFVTSLWTMIGGGLLGQGFGSPMGVVPPAAHDDFVLAVLTHRVGLVGLAMVLITYALIIGGGLWAAAGLERGSRADLQRPGQVDRARMLAVAAMIMVGIQVLVVVASVTGIAPVMGQPLPFLAAGGSQLLLFGFPAMGLVLVATRRQRGPSRPVSSPWFRKAAVLIAVAGVLGGLTVGARFVQLHRAARQTDAMALVELPVDHLRGGVVVKPARRGYRLTHAPGRNRVLRDGEEFVVGDTHFTYRQLDGDQPPTEVMSVPLRVFAAAETDSGLRGGFRRIDIGGDPVGAGSGTRDRVYVAHQRVQEGLRGEALTRFMTSRGVAHLLPPDGEVFRLEHRSLRIVPEVPGLEVVRGRDRRDLAVDAPSPLEAGDRLVGPGFDLEIFVEDRTLTAPRIDGDGTVVGQEAIREPVLVVMAHPPSAPTGSRRAWLAYDDREGNTAMVALASSQPTLLFGSRDRLAPLGGRVVPRDLTHEQLHQGFARGVELGALRLRRGYLVTSPQAMGHLRDEIGGTAWRQVRDVVRRYNGEQTPARVRVSGRVGGVDLAAPAGWDLDSGSAENRPAAGMILRGDALDLSPPGDFDPVRVAAGEERIWTLTRRLRLSEPGAGQLAVQSDLPLRVIVDGVRLGPEALFDEELSLSLDPGEHTLAIEARFVGRDESFVAPDHARDPREGVKLRLTQGVLTGLDPGTDRQRMASRAAPGRTRVKLSGQRLHLDVARGTGALDAGTRWWLDDEPSTLVVADPGEAGKVMDAGDGVEVHLDPTAPAPFTVVNRGQHSLALFRQLDPLRQPYRPSGGFAIHPAWAQPLLDDRDAVRLGARQITYRKGELDAPGGALTVVRRDGLHRLLLDGGSATVSEDLGGDHLAVRSSGEVAVLERAAPGTAVYRSGALELWVQGPDDLPFELAAGDAVSCPTSGLLLVARAEDRVLPDEMLPLARTASALSRDRWWRREESEVVLTLDSLLQQTAQDELDGQLERARTVLLDAGRELHPGPDGLGGAVVALDAVDGTVILAASSGSGRGPADAWGLAWFHPGSTFKIVTGLAALLSNEPGVQALLRGEIPAFLRGAGSLGGTKLPRVPAGGGRWQGGSDVPLGVRSRLDNYKRDPMAADADLETAYEKSYNVFFGYLALLMHRPLREGWGQVGIADAEARQDLLPLAAMAHRMGFGQVVDLVPSSARQADGRIAPIRDTRGRPVAAGDPLYGWTGSFPAGVLDDPQMAACGVGQGEVYATPLQMARVAAVLVNGGRLVHPTVIASVDGEITQPDEPTDLEIPDAALARVRTGLGRVVSQGTASLTFCDNPYAERVIGKTGSAERPGPDGTLVVDSWFVAVIQPPPSHPDDHPVAIACVLPGAGLGGTHAAEVVDRLSRQIARQRGWPTDGAVEVVARAD